MEVIENLIPHKGLMCLIDRIESWNESEIVCVATSHLSTDNPLRNEGRLHIVHGLEYAGQAMAIHGSLVNEMPSTPGLIAGSRNLKFFAFHLDAIEEPLRIFARSLGKAPNGLVYSFSVSVTQSVLISGQCSIIFPPEVA